MRMRQKNHAGGNLSPAWPWRAPFAEEEDGPATRLPATSRPTRRAALLPLVALLLAATTAAGCSRTPDTPRANLGARPNVLSAPRTAADMPPARYLSGVNRRILEHSVQSLSALRYVGTFDRTRFYAAPGKERAEVCVVAFPEKISTLGPGIVHVTCGGGMTFLKSDDGILLWGIKDTPKRQTQWGLASDGITSIRVGRSLTVPVHRNFYFFELSRPIPKNTEMRFMAGNETVGTMPVTEE